MVISQTGERADIEPSDRLSHALKSVERIVPGRFVTAFILVTGHGYSWRRVATDLGCSPSAVGYQLRQVRRALESLYRDESVCAKESV